MDKVIATKSLCYERKIIEQMKFHTKQKGSHSISNEHNKEFKEDLCASVVKVSKHSDIPNTIENTPGHLFKYLNNLMTMTTRTQLSAGVVDDNNNIS